MKKMSFLWKLGVISMICPTLLFASSDIQTNLNIVWLGIAGAMVMFMQVGFIALESGFTRGKNAVNVASKGILDFAVGAILYFSIGYAFMFGEGSFIGTTNFFLTDYISSGDSWGIMVWFFQVMFAGAAATIVSGAVAERVKLSGYVIACALIAGFIYPIFGHWAWSGEGWLAAMNFHDFAGSTVIHSLGGWLALAGAIVVGPRFGKFGKDGKVNAIPGHNIPLATLGTFILWFGWYGFNGGSTLLGDGSIAIVLLNTTLGGAAGALSAMIYSVFKQNKLVDLGMTLNGALAGLVSVTAGADVLHPGFGILIGLIAGVLVSVSVPFFDKIGVDDPVGAVSVHGVNGAWGTIAVGLFTAEYSLGTQLIGSVSVFVYAFGIGMIMFKLIDKLMGIRVTASEELMGLDIAEHGYSAYPEFPSHSEVSLFK
ncbi:ammonium transporter [uncultured Ilyobacter sp.]|uniref:ammonium transporter n=1 Tax=uncultured Ilyobacter sp. TaxID=544433 RepID=UPI0029C0A2D0|nr:ammonium transporter [uncultured Ilyobacter sp.]